MHQAEMSSPTETHDVTDAYTTAPYAHRRSQFAQVGVHRDQPFGLPAGGSADRKYQGRGSHWLSTNTDAKK